MTSPFPPLSRRYFIVQTTQAAVGCLVFPSLARAASARVKILEIKVISQEMQYYHGWSTLVRLKNGDLWVSWSGGRDSHVCPFGRVEAMVSHDDGLTWTLPRVLLDSATDDRDSGVLETAKGTLIVTTFTSDAYTKHLSEGQMFHIHTEKEWISKPLSPEQSTRWQAAHARLSETERKADIGQWCIRSTDGGLSWSTRIPTLVNSPHGPISLRDGRLLYAGKRLSGENRQVGVCESKDDGQTWEWLAEIPLRNGDKPRYHELHAVEAANGTLVVQIRNHNDENKGWTLQTESTDGGRSWSQPRPICYGFPSHLMRLRDGRLLMSYGYRRAPYGNRVRVSADHGVTWGEELVISADGATGDLGYPSTVELADGTLVTVWYESMGDTRLGVLRQAKWRLE